MTRSTGGCAMELPTRVPPPWFRLLVITPVVFVGCVVVTILSPLLHLLLLLIDLVDRKSWRFSRLGGLGIALCVCELVGLLMAFALWVGSGFGWAIHRPAFQRAHNTIFGWYLELLTRALRFYLGFEFVIPSTEQVSGPVLTLARHAGPGDAFLLARMVIRDYRRQLRMLGTTKLLWDPFIDHVLRRMPYYFCDQNPRDATEHLAAIGEMCRTMDDRSVLIVFPEGGNWTPGRWQTAIERLEARGMHDRATRVAATMTHVLPPRTAGTIAAIGARPDMTVVFVAHVGLEDLVSLRDIWRNVPLRRRVIGAYWSVPATSIPSDRELLSDWMFDQWERVDEWISEHSGEVYGTGSEC